MIITGKTFRFISLEEALNFYEIDENGCHIFKGSCTPEGKEHGNKWSKKGYGHFSIKGKHYYAHRASYEFHKGKIPPKLFCLHKCNEKSCHNPDHLYLGTAADNARDRSKAQEKDRLENPGLEINQEILANTKEFLESCVTSPKITIIFPEALYDRLKLFCCLSKCSLSKFIRTAVTQKLNEMKNNIKNR